MAEIAILVPGRGMWTKTGGLLPLKPESMNPAGYYRPPHTDKGEKMVGSAYASGRDKNYHTYVVYCAVKVLQRLVGVTADGWLGDKTGAAIVAKQRQYELTRDAVAGPVTLRALLTPTILSVANLYRIPIEVLGGVCVWESRLDPGAVGVSGYDTGIAQINLSAPAAKDFTVQQVLDPDFALSFTAEGMKKVYDRWMNRTSVDLWDIAIANHNSPASAQEWALTGKAPFSQYRKDRGYPQINEYVQSVRSAW